VATLGSTVEGATTANVGADIVVWASSSGAYAGVSLNGTLVKPNRDDNASYYGRPVTVTDIVVSRRVRNPAAAPLVRTLNAL
jgi:lipid-binding SYLF domain-containing protein